jgi:hypothetical protein
VGEKRIVWKFFKNEGWEILKLTENSSSPPCSLCPLWLIIISFFWRGRWRACRPWLC